MKRLLTTVVTAAAVFASVPAWACMPMPPNASATMEGSQTVLVGRVSVVDQSPPGPCIAEARARGYAVIESLEDRANHAAIQVENDMGFQIAPVEDEPGLVWLSKRLR